MYQVRLTKFVEGFGSRFRLQRTVTLPMPPSVGMILAEFSRNSWAKMIVEKIVVTHGTELIDCVLEKGELKERQTIHWMQVSYGPEWDVGETPM